jgi:hypothetical protein
MQFYLNGYTPSDPDMRAAAPGALQPRPGLPEAVDVLIVGSGPAGTLLAAQLSTFPGFSTRLVERRDGPLQLGQADGVACRTVEMFEAFGLGAEARARGLLSQRDRVLAPVRTGRIQDTEDGLSEMPHRQPGPPAAVPARRHAHVADTARGRLRPGIRHPEGCGWPTPNRCCSAMPRVPMAPGASTPSAMQWQTIARARRLSGGVAELTGPPLHPRRERTSTASSTFARCSERCSKARVPTLYQSAAALHLVPIGRTRAARDHAGAGPGMVRRISGEAKGPSCRWDRN